MIDITEGKIFFVTVELLRNAAFGVHALPKEWALSDQSVTVTGTAPVSGPCPRVAILSVGKHYSLWRKG